MKVKLTKMCGAGNDFLITDETQFSNASQENFSNFISQIPKLCDRKFGLGADGFCFLSLNSQLADLKWEFFNSDGSQASMCGNAACCIVDYTYKKKLIQKNPFTFEIQKRCLTGGIKENKTWIQTQVPQLIKKIHYNLSPSKSIPIQLIDSGVLHLVIDESTVSEEPQKLAQKLREKYPDANVTYYTHKNGPSQTSNRTFARTFERGVEDFTLACGTGALAVAFLIKDQKSQKIEMPGGTLNVNFKNNQVELQSPVQWIAEISPFL